MKTLSRLSIAATIAAIWTCALAAPPRFTDRRPVVIGAPIPEDAPPAPQPRADSLAAVQPQSPSESAAPASAADELTRARELLLKHGSIHANIVETVAIFDRSYKAEGRYVQKGLKGDEWQMRLELSLKVGDSTGNLLEVCDGDVLWTSTQIETGRRLGRKEKAEHVIVRRNVKEILEAARKRGEKIESLLVAELGLGGVPALLASIQEDMVFGEPRQETLRDRPVLVIEGTWSEASLARWQNPAQLQPAGAALLPSFVPDSVRISIDRQTGFPLRFLYRKKIPNREVHRDMLTLDFLDVTVNQPVASEEFAYEPPTGVQPLELTKFYLERLGPMPDAGTPFGGPPGP